MKRKSSLLFFFMMVIFLWVGLLNTHSLLSSAQSEEMVSKPGEYSGYSPVLYDGDELFSQYVTVRDGTKLAVDIWRPTSGGVLVEDPLPVVWMHTPYNRRYYGIALTVNLYPGAARGLVRYGYVVATVDMRGMYASYGTTYSGNFWDAYDITEWFAEQPWCDGNVGLWGCSATGASQLAAANLMPPSLKAIFPMSCGFPEGRGVSLPPETPILPPPDTVPGSIPAADARAVSVDEDLDGSMLAAAKEEHRYNYLVGPSVPVSRDQIEASGVAIYNAANWWDNPGAVRGHALLFNNVANQSKLLFGPGTHCIWCTEWSLKPPPLDFKIITEELRFFDYWLKDIDNGIVEEPPIYYYAHNADVGRDWRFSWQWPIPNAKASNFYLNAGPSGEGYGLNDGALTRMAPAVYNAKDIYTTDYSIAMEMILPIAAPGVRRILTQPEAVTKGLAYTTETLETDMKLIGHPVIHLWISSSATDGDFWVELEDVAPDGTATSMIATGAPGDSISTLFPPGRPLSNAVNGIRASYRVLSEPDFNNLGLPYRQIVDENVNPLVPNEPTELVFDLRPVSHVVKAGHRIRMMITCVIADSTPRLSPPPEVTIYRNPMYLSYITLPVVAPIEAQIRIEPQVLNLKSKGVFTAFVSFPDDLPEGYIKDLDVESVTLSGIPPLRGKLAGNKWIFKFNRQDFAELLDVGKNKLTLEGAFGAKYYYGDSFFEGSDWVRVKKAKKGK